MLEKDFEQGMANLWQTSLEKVPPLTSEMPQYFSQFKPSMDSSDCYSQIAKLIAEHGLVANVAFATLNYECVLDLALKIATKQRIVYANPSKPFAAPILWKLHGGCNLVPDNNWTMQGNTYGIQQIFDGPVKAIEPSAIGSYFDRMDVPPVMSVYMPGKPTQTSTGILSRIRSEWQEWTESVAAVVVIGAKPILKETYIWQPIISGNSKIYWVGGRDGDYEELAAKLADRLVFLAPTFEAGLTEVLAVLTTAALTP